MPPHVLQIRWLLAWFTMVFGSLGAAMAEEHGGDEIYRQQCAKCHGAAGEGVKEHGKPLLGDRSLVELAAYVAENMPDDAPGTCLGDDARKVSEYIYHAFYSPVAQARNQPARNELSRLTAQQYRNTVTDLVGSFHGFGDWDTERGLKAEYYKAENFRREDRAFERIDPTVDFHFGEGSPDSRMPAESFSIRWQGGVFAPDSGEYEFLLTAETGTKLWINDPQRPLIDAEVKSGSDTEYRATIELLGGRVYPLRLQVSKSQKAKEKSASMVLRWRPPRSVPQVIPERCLSPGAFNRVFVLTTRFPPDDRSLGYERGAAVSQAWSQATADAALEVAGHVVARLPELSGAQNEDSDRVPKLKEFCRRWAQRAFRRPLDAEETAFFVEQPFAVKTDPQAAVERSLLLTLLSPRFLYCELPAGKNDSYRVAARLALALWDSLPDEQLAREASSGSLAKPDEVRRQAERMASDLRARTKLRAFFLHWLNVERFAELSKDAKAFPEFDRRTITDLRTSLDMFLDDVIWSDASDFRQLLLSEDLFLNGRLSKLYGVSLPEDAPFQKVSLATNPRAGVLTHPYLMAGLAYSATSSPIHRGVFVARNVLGRSLRPPPEAVTPVSPELRPDLSTRERIALQTQAGACQSCHRMINPLGFALENFDAVGRFRAAERNRLIDSAGEYQARSGVSVPFNNVRELALFLATNEETHEAFVEQMFHNFIKQPIRALETERRAELSRRFAAQDFNIRKLMVEIALTAALETEKKSAVAAGP